MLLRNAARTIGDLSEPLSRIAKDPNRKLTEISGIGVDLAEKIHTLLATGKLPLLEELKARGVDHAVIVGAMSHMCIDATTRAAYDLGLRCTLVHDACATRDLEFRGKKVKADEVHASFMAALGWWYATLTSAADFAADPARSS